MKLNRRNLLVAAPALAVGTAACQAEGPGAKSSPSPRGTFLLVHGAWHGSWCYQRVAEDLRRRGHRVFTVTLGGLAERAHSRTPRIGLADHVRDVVDLVSWEDLDDFTLVGHSYGGMVITGAMEELGAKVRAIVYLDAYLPGNGQSLADVAGEKAEDIESDARAAGGFLPPIPAAAFGVEEANQAYVDSKCTAQPARTFVEALPIAEAYDRVPRKIYLRATKFQFPLFDEIETALRERPGWDVRRWDVSHDMMIDRPEQTADLLEEALV